MRLAIAVLALAVTTSCTAPSGIAPVAGVWNTTTDVQAVGVQTPSGSGFTCDGLTLLANGGISRSTNSTLQISQNGANLSATSTSQSGGATTLYTGVAGATTADLSFSSCNLCEVRGAACGGGVVLDLTPQTGSVTATVLGSTMGGTTKTVYALTDSGTGAPFGTLQVDAKLAATKQ